MNEGKTMKKAIITNTGQTNFLWILEGGQAVECHPLINDTPFKLGSIYIGRVEKIVKNINSAFIRLDEDHVGYLPLDNKPCIVLNRTLPKGLSSLAENDYVLVQVIQEPLKMKQARVTGNINLNGTYVAVDFNKEHCGISKKIKDEARYQKLQTLIAPNPDYGYVLRTASEQADDERILEEYHFLTDTMDNLKKRALYEKKTGCIYNGREDYMDLLDSYGVRRFDEIITDMPDILKNLQTYGVNQAVLYENEYPLSKLYSLETELEHILSTTSHIATFPSLPKYTYAASASGDANEKFSLTNFCIFWIVSASELPLKLY